MSCYCRLHFSFAFQVISEIRPNRAGLGLKNEVKFEMSKKQDEKQYLLEITRRRFQKAEIFPADDDESNTM